MPSEEEPAEAAAAGDASNGNNEDEEDLALNGITDPRDTDVLCGRGGAALRHPGNQTYRRLVNLNKSLYITCAKTEKLKISRSIVAAIREQEGRFLERDAKKSTWYDIGDKKAIEKTSQALREGQPKLRQKMIDRGEFPANSGSNTEQQFGNGMYEPKNSGSSMGGSGSATGAAGGGGGSGVYHDPATAQFGMQNNQMRPPSNFMGMPPPPARTLSQDVSTDAMMQRLSITSLGAQSIPSFTPSMTPSLASSMDGETRSMRSRLRPSLQPGGSGVAGDLGFNPEEAMSIRSDFSGIGAGFAVNDGGYLGIDTQQQQLTSQMENPYALNAPSVPPPPPPAMSPMMESPSMRGGYDRRRVFAKMKYNRPASGRFGSQRSVGDGMPDIHMVESNFSLSSNLSGHGSRHDPNSTGFPSFSGHGGDAMEGIGVGSRRSLMSGLSRISDHSRHSVFSDLSKKVGATNMSTRSIAMSEVSGIDESSEMDNLIEFNFDAIGKPP